MITLFLLLPLLRSWLPIIVMVIIIVRNPTVVIIVIVPFSFAFSRVPQHGPRARHQRPPAPNRVGRSTAFDSLTRALC
jgi:hypothetical protein